MALYFTFLQCDSILTIAPILGRFGGEILFKKYTNGLSKKELHKRNIIVSKLNISEMDTIPIKFFMFLMALMTSVASLAQDPVYSQYAEIDGIAYTLYGYKQEA